MGGENSDVHNASERSCSLPEYMAYVSSSSHSCHKRPTTYNHIDGLSTIYRTEGMRGLYRGTLLALVGVSNGALQFMAYERIKSLAFKQKRRSFDGAGKPWTAKDDKLVNSRIHAISACIVLPADQPSLSPVQPNATYIIASGVSKLFALSITYPYQVVRARIQVRSTSTILIHLTFPHRYHRTTPRRTYIPISPRASHGRTPKEA